jgi:hypothetical protein
MDQRASIRDAAERNVCPRCGKPLEREERIGSGRVADGVFCSLGCYAEFHSEHLLERQQLGTPNPN